MYKLSIIKINAGDERIKPSLIINLTIKPKSIKSERPMEENTNIKGNFNPISNPMPPKISKMPVNFLRLSDSLNLINSFFIDEVKRQRIP